MGKFISEGKMKIRKLTTRGRVTIPEDIRKKYNFKPGVKISFAEKQGKIYLMRVDKK
ncbi:MAG TPA: AbrB/MazE/SpoVT family DNA-binding domain-containing protein [Ignavibacteriaceae bacterium]|nr:AbrB/MazE/SpoVT family DNA-binding domain-containing protein [Ignavibacteriaceae bacterium]